MEYAGSDQENQDNERINRGRPGTLNYRANLRDMNASFNRYFDAITTTNELTPVSEANKKIIDDTQRQSAWIGAIDSARRQTGYFSRRVTSIKAKTKNYNDLADSLEAMKERFNKLHAGDAPDDKQKAWVAALESAGVIYHDHDGTIKAVHIAEFNEKGLRAIKSKIQATTGRLNGEIAANQGKVTAAIEQIATLMEMPEEAKNKLINDTINSPYSGRISAVEGWTAQASALKELKDEFMKKHEKDADKGGAAWKEFIDNHHLGDPSKVSAKSVQALLEEQKKELLPAQEAVKENAKKIAGILGENPEKTYQDYAGFVKDGKMKDWQKAAEISKYKLEFAQAAAEIANTRKITDPAKIKEFVNKQLEDHWGKHVNEDWNKVDWKNTIEEMQKAASTGAQSPDASLEQRIKKDLGRYAKALGKESDKDINDLVREEYEKFIAEVRNGGNWDDIAKKTERWASVAEAVRDQGDKRGLKGADLNEYVRVGVPKVLLTDKQQKNADALITAMKEGNGADAAKALREINPGDQGNELAARQLESMSAADIKKLYQQNQAALDTKTPDPSKRNLALLGLANDMALMQMQNHPQPGMNPYANPTTVAQQPQPVSNPTGAVLPMGPQQQYTQQQYALNASLSRMSEFGRAMNTALHENKLAKTAGLNSDNNYDAMARLRDAADALRVLAGPDPRKLEVAESLNKIGLMEKPEDREKALNKLFGEKNLDPDKLRYIINASGSNRRIGAGQGLAKTYLNNLFSHGANALEGAKNEVVQNAQAERKAQAAAAEKAHQKEGQGVIIDALNHNRANAVAAATTAIGSAGSFATPALAELATAPLKPTDVVKAHGVVMTGEMIDEKGNKTNVTVSVDEEKKQVVIKDSAGHVITSKKAVALTLDVGDGAKQKYASVNVNGQGAVIPTSVPTEVVSTGVRR